MVKEETWCDYVDRRKEHPSYWYTWVSNEDHFERYRRLDNRICEQQSHAYEMAQWFPSGRPNISVQQPAWRPKRPKVQEAEQPQKQ